MLGPKEFKDMLRGLILTTLYHESIIYSDREAEELFSKLKAQEFRDLDLALKLVKRLCTINDDFCSIVVDGEARLMLAIRPKKVKRRSVEVSFIDVGIHRNYDGIIWLCIDAVMGRLGSEYIDIYEIVRFPLNLVERLHIVAKGIDVDVFNEHSVDFRIKLSKPILVTFARLDKTLSIEIVEEELAARVLR